MFLFCFVLFPLQQVDPNVNALVADMYLKDIHGKNSNYPNQISKKYAQLFPFFSVLFKSFHNLQITAANRSDCEDKCLNEFSFVCRSANYDSNLRSCSLTRYTRRTHPELLEDDPNSDYLENTCLNGKNFRVLQAAIIHSFIQSIVRLEWYSYVFLVLRLAERRCEGLTVFIKEENKRLGGPFEVDIFNNMTLEECQNMCVRAEK